jgi:hypothetical protein
MTVGELDTKVSIREKANFAGKTEMDFDSSITISLPKYIEFVVARIEM